MPKQGQFGRKIRKNHIKNIIHGKVKKQQRTISDDMFVDFVLIRYALTTKKHFNKVIAETNQRFLQELMPVLKGKNGDERKAVQLTVSAVNSRVPWQFYQEISNSWSQISRFIGREIPVVPLASQLLITNPVTPAELNAMIIKELAVKITAITFINKSVPASIKIQFNRQIQKAIMVNHGINWHQVAQLLDPFPFNCSDAPDDATRRWLQMLIQEN